MGKRRIDHSTSSLSLTKKRKCVINIRWHQMKALQVANEEYFHLCRETLKKCFHFHPYSEKKQASWSKQLLHAIHKRLMLDPQTGLIDLLDKLGLGWQALSQCLTNINISFDETEIQNIGNFFSLFALQCRDYTLQDLISMFMEYYAEDIDQYIKRRLKHFQDVALVRYSRNRTACHLVWYSQFCLSCLFQLGVSFPFHVDDISGDYRWKVVLSSDKTKFQIVWYWRQKRLSSELFTGETIMRFDHPQMKVSSYIPFVSAPKLLLDIEDPTGFSAVLHLQYPRTTCIFTRNTVKKSVFVNMVPYLLYAPTVCALGVYLGTTASAKIASFLFG